MRVLVSFLAVSIVALCGVAPLYGQTPRPERPYRGLFAGGGGESTHSLVAVSSLGGGWDDSLASNARGSDTVRLSDLNTDHSGGVGNFGGSLNYSFGDGPLTFGAVGGFSGRYFPSLEDELGDSVLVRKHASAQGAARIVAGLTVDGAVAYRPYSLAALFSGAFDQFEAEPVVDEELPSSLVHYAMYSAGASYEHRLSSRTTASIGYSYRSRAALSGEDRAFRRQSGRAGVTHQMGRNLSLRLGYGYTDARYSSNDGHFGGHTIDAGVDYGRALSFSRRTTVSFSTGTSAVQRARGDDTSLRFRATGRSQLVHEIGRSWNTSLTYSRGYLYSESWPEPVFRDSVTAALGGLFTRRLQFSASARTSNGRAALQRANEDSGFDSFAGMAALQYALSRYASTGVSYLYYRHDFSQGIQLAPEFPDYVSRQRLTVYVSLWAPIFSNARRP